MHMIQKIKHMCIIIPKHPNNTHINPNKFLSIHNKKYSDSPLQTPIKITYKKLNAEVVNLSKKIH